MLDASGFVRGSQVFAANVREHHTLAGMLEALQAPTGALVVIDRGVATDDCIAWLRDNGYRYLVVSRERRRRFDADAAVSIQTQSKQTVHLHKVLSTDPDEVRLYCYSEQRAEKERGIVERFAARFETALNQLNDGAGRQRLVQSVRGAGSRLHARLPAGGRHHREGADAGAACHGRRRTGRLDPRHVYSTSERQYGQSAYAENYVAVNGPAVTDFLRLVTGDRRDERGSAAAGAASAGGSTWPGSGCAAG